jgi:hypothetical protein
LTLSVLRIVRFFRIGKSDGRLVFINMRLKDEFSFAPAEQIHRIGASTQRSNQSRTLHHLNEANPDLAFDPFLAWRLRFAGTHVG